MPSGVKNVKRTGRYSSLLNTVFPDVRAGRKIVNTRLVSVVFPLEADMLYRPNEIGREPIHGKTEDGREKKYGRIYFRTIFIILKVA